MHWKQKLKDLIQDEISIWKRIQKSVKIQLYYYLYKQQKLHQGSGGAICWANFSPLCLDIILQCSVLSKHVIDRPIAWYSSRTYPLSTRQAPPTSYQHLQSDFHHYKSVRSHNTIMFRNNMHCIYDSKEIPCQYFWRIHEINPRHWLMICSDSVLTLLLKLHGKILWHCSQFWCMLAICYGSWWHGALREY